jgi:Ca2+-transporting ATPase
MTKTTTHQQSVDEITKALNTNLEKGLDAKSIQLLQEANGYNELTASKKRPWILKFFDQINDFMIYVLFAASIISFITDETAEGFLILAIIFINAFLGLFQEAKAEKALTSIKAMSSPHTKVIRDGVEQVIDVKNVCIGDIVILDAGDYMPADVRIIESYNLKVDESTLTGEAVPVDKHTKIIEEENVALGDRKNLGYMGTVVTYGRGKAIVTSIGMQTELGKIATMLDETQNETTPLQKTMAQLGKTLALVALAITFLIFVISIVEAYIIDGSVSVEILTEALLTSIALAVAAIPEGLPAIITIVLALGMQTLVSQKAIIRTLPAVETLGSTKIICSDKTGTLTQNLMTVTHVYTASKMFDVANYKNIPDEVNKLMTYGVLCNDTKVNKKDNDYIKIGDPTEIAFIDLAIALKEDPTQIFNAHKRIYELPFDSNRKLMTTVHDFKDGRYAVIKGAPDVVFGLSTSIHNDENIKHLSLFEKANQDMANQALRVLAVAYKKIDATIPLDQLANDILETELTLVGLVGMIDPAREEVKDSIALCKSAGIKTIMITGDHINTAVAIAKTLHILSDGELAITGHDLDQMDDEAFNEKIENIRVYARVSPEHKVRIVEAWKNKNMVVAMTGDGVNDAPSIKKADIGIAMGITGTEVAKGAADMILTDDNFSTIVNAVSEGRRIFSNIKKAIHFLLSCNIGEIITIFLGTTLGILIFGGRVTTLTAVQILWVNLVTDSLIAIALGLEPKEDDIMSLSPRDTNKSIFADGFGRLIALQGVMIGLISFAAYFIGWHTAPVGIDPEISAETMTFIVLAFSQLVHGFNVRSQYQSTFKLKMNKYMIYAFLASASLQLLVVFLPFARHIFGIDLPSLIQWLYMFILIMLPLGIVEISKLIKNKKHK